MLPQNLKGADNMSISLKIGEYEPADPQSFHIEYWYNRHERAWVVQVFDDLSREHESEYCPDKQWRDSSIKGFCEKYSTQDVRKV